MHVLVVVGVDGVVVQLEGAAPFRGLGQTHGPAPIVGGRGAEEGVPVDIESLAVHAGFRMLNDEPAGELPIEDARIDGHASPDSLPGLRRDLHLQVVLQRGFDGVLQGQVGGVHLGVRRFRHIRLGHL